MFFDVLLSKLFYKEKVHKFQQIYGKMGGIAENQIAGAAAARLFFLTAVAIAIATRPFKFHEISVSNTSSSFVSSIHSFVYIIVPWPHSRRRGNLCSVIVTGMGWIVAAVSLSLVIFIVIK